MLLKYIYENSYYQFEDEFKDWRDAIKASFKILLNNKIVDESYVKATIESVEKYGPYIIIAPYVAIPHASEGHDGCKGTAVSLMKVRNTVKFDPSNDERNVKLFFSIASNDKEQHMKNVKLIADTISDFEILNDLINEVENETMFKEYVKKKYLN